MTTAMLKKLQTLKECEPVHINCEKKMMLSGYKILNEKDLSGADFENCTDVLIENCWIHGCKKLISFYHCKNVTVRNCVLTNPAGPPDPDGQAIQLNECGNFALENNFCFLIKGAWAVEDWINIFKSTNGSIRGNVILGGVRSSSGTGICVDGDESQNISIDKNTIVEAGAIGIHVTGSNTQVKGNWILDTFSKDPDAGNVGIAVSQSYSKIPKNVVLSNNIIDVLRRDGSRNQIWDQRGIDWEKKNRTGPAIRNILLDRNKWALEQVALIKQALSIKS